MRKHAGCWSAYDIANAVAAFVDRSASAAGRGRIIVRWPRRVTGRKLHRVELCLDSHQLRRDIWGVQ